MVDVHSWTKYFCKCCRDGLPVKVGDHSLHDDFATHGSRPSPVGNRRLIRDGGSAARISNGAILMLKHNQISWVSDPIKFVLKSEYARAQVHIIIFTPQVADPPRSNTCSSYMSCMTGLGQVSAQLDSPEGATTPWPTNTVPPDVRVVPAPRRPLQLPETTITRGPRPSLRTTSYSKPLRTGIIFADLTT